MNYRNSNRQYAGRAEPSVNMDRQAKSLKLVGLSREERRVKKERNERAMKEYILCRWKKGNKKKKGKEEGEKSIHGYTWQNLPQFSRWFCKPDA